MENPTTKVKKYYQQPVYGEGCLQEVRHFLYLLKGQDLKAEGRVRILLWPVSWLRLPVRALLKLPLPLRVPIIAVAVVFLSLPFLIMFIGLCPYWLVWLLILALAQSRDINNLLLEICEKMLNLWEETGHQRDRLKLTVDARHINRVSSELPISSLIEDSHPALYKASRSPLFCLEDEGTRLEAFMETRWLHYTADMAGLPDSFSERVPLEQQSWYRIRLSEQGEIREILGETSYLYGFPPNHNKERGKTAAHFLPHGVAQPPAFPWEALKQALTRSSPP